MKQPRTNFDGIAFGNKAGGFDGPTQLPRNELEREAWQRANQAWWQETPMRYDWRDVIAAPFGTRKYFAEVDRRFLTAAEAFIPSVSKPFDRVIPYDQLPNLDVLEIGTGQGTHAQLIAANARNYTGIDLTERAAEATRTRLRLFGLRGTVEQMDAESMSFEDESFDYIWSWGVIHHSADTRRILREMHRVLRPGGRATVMVYHRNWWNLYVTSGLLKGVLQGQLWRNAGLHGVMQAATDGAIARFYRPREWRATCHPYFDVTSMQVMGVKSELIPLPAGRCKELIQRAIPDRITRMLSRSLGMGSQLVAEMRRR